MVGEIWSLRLMTEILKKSVFSVVFVLFDIDGH